MVPTPWKRFEADATDDAVETQGIRLKPGKITDYIEAPVGGRPQMVFEAK